MHSVRLAYIEHMARAAKLKQHLPANTIRSSMHPANLIRTMDKKIEPPTQNVLCSPRKA